MKKLSFLGVLFALILSACSGTGVGGSNFDKTLVGSWQGNFGEQVYTFTFDSTGAFNMKRIEGLGDYILLDATGFWSTKTNGVLTLNFNQNNITCGINPDAKLDSTFLNQVNKEVFNDIRAEFISGIFGGSLSNLETTGGVQETDYSLVDGNTLRINITTGIGPVSKLILHRITDI